MEHGGYQPASRTGHGAAAFGHDSRGAEAVRDHHLIIELMDAFADFHEVQRFFARQVRNTKAAAEIDELDLDAELVMQLVGQREHEPGCEQECFGAAFVRGNHCMQAEPFDAFFLGATVSFDELIMCQSVFGFGRFADDVIALNQVARIVTEAEHLRQSGIFFQIVEMGDVIEVDDRAQFDGFLELVGRGVVGGQQDLFAFDAGDIREHELGLAAAVRAGTLFVQDLDDARVRQCLDGKLFPESRSPGKGLLQGADILADGMFVIDMERSRILFDDFLKLRFREWEIFFGHIGIPPNR